MTISGQIFSEKLTLPWTVKAPICWRSRPRKFLFFKWMGYEVLMERIYKGRYETSYFACSKEYIVDHSTYA